MNSTLLLSTLGAWWQRLAGRIQQARRYRQDQRLLSAMSEHELRDLGLSHAGAWRSELADGGGAMSLTVPGRASRP
jgi:uncharacterized protein YjiS (DUF1127 family)